MAKFKVAVIEILLKNNKTAKYGQLVEETELNGKADDLVSKGFVTKATKSDLDSLKKEESKAEAEAKAKAEAEAKAKAEAKANEGK